MGCKQSTLLSASDQVIISHSFTSVLEGKEVYLKPLVSSVNTSYAQHYLHGSTLMHMLPLACFTLDPSKYAEVLQMLIDKFSDAVTIRTKAMTIYVDIQETKKDEEIQKKIMIETPFGTIPTLLEVNKSDFKSNRMIFHDLTVHSLAIKLFHFFETYANMEPVDDNINLLLTTLLSLRKNGQIAKYLHKDDEFGTLCLICESRTVNVCLLPCGHCSFCHDCLQTVLEDGRNTCPICNQNIEHVQQIYMSGRKE